MFFLIVFSIWALILLHIFLRTQVLLGLRPIPRLIFGLCLLLAGFGYVPARILLASDASNEIAILLTRATALFIGYTTILWTIYVGLEVAAIPVWMVTRRRIGKAPLRYRRLLAALLWGIAGILSAMGMRAAQSAPEVTELRLAVPGVQPKRYVVISDSHLGATSSFQQWRLTLESARELNPDGILIPGDLMDDSSVYARSQASEIRKYFPDLPVYVTTGNHDFYSGAERFAQSCARLHFRLLREESETLTPGLLIAGIDDEHTLPAQSAVEQLLPKLQGPVILLSHRPAAAELLRNRPMTLVLSGHTHGGQTLPMVFLVSLANGWFRAGIYKVGAADLYISRGTGVWGPPVRVLAPPELVLISVHPGDQFRLEKSGGSSVEN